MYNKLWQVINHNNLLKSAITLVLLFGMYIDHKEQVLESGIFCYDILRSFPVHLEAFPCLIEKIISKNLFRLYFYATYLYNMKCESLCRRLHKVISFWRLILVHLKCRCCLWLQLNWQGSPFIMLCSMLAMVCSFMWLKFSILFLKKNTNSCIIFH